jgi:hypothetical protein
MLLGPGGGSSDPFRNGLLDRDYPDPMYDDGPSRYGGGSPWDNAPSGRTGTNAWSDRLPERSPYGSGDGYPLIASNPLRPPASAQEGIIEDLKLVLFLLF